MISRTRAASAARAARPRSAHALTSSRSSTVTPASGGDGTVDVARQGDVDDEQLAALPRRKHVGGDQALASRRRT